MSTRTHTPTGLRSSLANAAWAVEERVVWGAGDALRGAGEVVKWPFERLAWAVERGLLWPLEERTSAWSGPLRAAGMAFIAVVAIGAGVAGLIWAAPDKKSEPVVVQAPPPPRLPIAPTPTKVEGPAAPVLQGATPVFVPRTADKVGDISQAQAKTDAKAAPVEAADSAKASAAGDAKAGPGAGAAVGEPAGPAAIKVAHQFANAFVLYETGRDNARVRATFTETATPQLKGALLRRPPRLPANVQVPRAKVLNLVAGPSHGGVYTISVSLLRVGLTSELRLDMKKSKKSGWQVTDVLG